MMLDDTEDTITMEFVLESVEETTPPKGEENGQWYSYTIGRGNSVISGKSAGTVRSVTEHAEKIVEDLNSRSNRQGSIYVSRRTAKKG